VNPRGSNQKGLVFSDFKVSEVGRGDFPLSEYTSRPCRLKLVELIHRAIRREVEAKRERGISHSRASASSLLASMLGVTKRTINHWLSETVHSCNMNADKLIRLALKYDPYQTADLLYEDFENHRWWLQYTLNGVGKGVFPHEMEAVT